MRLLSLVLQEMTNRRKRDQMDGGSTCLHPAEVPNLTVFPHLCITFKIDDNLDADNAVQNMLFKVESACESLRDDHWDNDFDVFVSESKDETTGMCYISFTCW